MFAVLGIDTSNYTTSLCAVRWETGEMLAQARKLLPVTAGERGLRQSEALFFHVQQIPQVMDELIRQMRQVATEPVSWVGIGVSVRPRPVAASYMPVFTAGDSFARTFARAVGAPVVRTTHQEGHLAAAQYFLDMDKGTPFLGVHISGGTSDVLYAAPTRFGYAIEPIGEGADLHAGQFVDRVGVALGLPFPAGPHLEKLAASAAVDTGFRIGGRALGTRLSFSGPCSAALRAVEQGREPAEIARAVFISIANAVVKAVSAALEHQPDVKDCVIAGGVASNQLIKDRIRHRLGILHADLTVHFAPPAFSSDNALGVASIAHRFLRA